MGIKWTKDNSDYSSEDDYFSDDDEEDQEEEEEEVKHGFLYETNNSYQLVDDMIDNIDLDSASDALDAAPHAATMTIMLNLDQVMQIENRLDVHEKVSLVYLLYDDPTSALDHLLKLIKGFDDKLIYNWAIQQNLKSFKWHEKLVEAVCVIQNYEVLRHLGFRQEDLRVRFTPHHDFTFVYLNKIRKCLYRLCEDFDSYDVQKLLNLICPDFQAKGYSFKIYDPQYLELYFLYWEVIGYIKQNNLSNICSILKQMNQLDWYDKLKLLVPPIVVELKIPEKTKTVDNKQSISFIDPTLNTSVFFAKTKTIDGRQPKSLIDQILNPSASLTSLESQISADNAPFVSSENKYDIDAENPGVCLIINQENFYREIDPGLQHLLPPIENKLESRTGTQQDREKLEATFKTFGFRVVTEDNLIHSEIPNKIAEVMQTITQESSFFVCIMSHGDEGVIYGVNSCRIAVKTIKNLICSKNRPHLSGKPKVLILQSCQGQRCQKISASEDDDIVIDGPSSSIPEIVPPRADLFTFWATVPGYGAIRNKKTGSWFIQSLCENMKTLSDKHHFEDICTAVIKDVSSKKWSQTKEDVAMVPLKDSTFRKLFYLPKIRS